MKKKYIQKCMECARDCKTTIIEEACLCDKFQKGKRIILKHKKKNDFQRGAITSVNMVNYI